MLVSASSYTNLCKTFDGSNLRYDSNRPSHYLNAVYKSEGEKQMNNGNEIQKDIEAG